MWGMVDLKIEPRRHGSATCLTESHAPAYRCQDCQTRMEIVSPRLASRRKHAMLDMEMNVKGLGQTTSKRWIDYLSRGSLCLQEAPPIS